jgi:hypothetical protein
MGFGQQQQPQQMAYPAQQMGFGQQQQEQMMNAGVSAPPNSPGMGQPLPMNRPPPQMGGFAAPQQQGFGPQRGHGGGRGYAPVQQGRVPQSMGGNWM